MARILRTPQSRDDYAVIYSYIAEDNPRNAEIILRLFDEKLSLLAEHPFFGRPRPEFAAHLRSWVVHRFVLFYRPLENGIELIRVLHGSMDITARFF
jgi:toxin ParE1/3/4